MASAIYIQRTASQMITELEIKFSGNQTFCVCSNESFPLTECPNIIMLLYSMLFK